MYNIVCLLFLCFFFFQAEDGIRDIGVTGVQTCALPILIEAARADGAGELRISHTIVLPVSIPAIVTVFLYGFMWSWNDLLYALTLIVSEDKRTIGPGLLLSYLNEVNADWGGAMAASLVASAPVVIAFAFLQRWFIQG